MQQFLKNRIKVLEYLKDLVSNILTEEHVVLSRDIRRRNRILKSIRKKISEWIIEIEDEEKRKESERRREREERKISEMYRGVDY
jgi:hypothetical protein